MIKPSPAYQKAWQGIKLGILTLPLATNLGIIGIVFAMISLWWHQYRRLLRDPFNWGLGLFGVWLLVTTVLANNRLEAAQGLANFLPFMALLAAFRGAIQTPTQLRQLAWRFVLPSVAVVLLGFFQLGAGWVSPPFLGFLGAKLIAWGNPDGRMSSTFMYANILAIYLLVAFTLSLGLWIDVYQQGKQGKRKYFREWVILSFAVFLNGIGLFLTNSRSAWGLALFILIAFAVYLRWYWPILAVAIAVVLVFWAAWGPIWGQETLRAIVPISLWGRFSDELYPDRYVTALRSTQWQVAWEMFLQRPTLGWGLRNFTPFYQAKMNVWIGHPHNLYLMLLAEIGIPGTLILMGLVGWVMSQAVRSLWWSQPLAKQVNPSHQRQHLILLTYLLAFSNYILFNCFDVSIFDFRSNLLGWFLLSAISGVVWQNQAVLKKL